MSAVKLDSGRDIMIRLRGVIDDPCYYDNLYTWLAELGGRQFSPEEFTSAIWDVFARHLKTLNPNIQREALAFFAVVECISEIIFAVANDNGLHKAAMDYLASRMPR